MISAQQQSILKEELLKMKNNLQITEKNTTIKESAQEASGELSMYDNHPADMATELFEREKDLALNEHAESELGKVKEALNAINKGVYGLCKICNEDIPFERLEAVPYTTLCIEHAKEEETSVEEDTALNSVENPFDLTRDKRGRDYENSFQEVAEFGTSDSPSDFIDSDKPTYADDNDCNTYKSIDKLVGKSITDNPNMPKNN